MKNRRQNVITCCLAGRMRHFMAYRNWNIWRHVKNFFATTVKARGRGAEPKPKTSHSCRSRNEDTFSEKPEFSQEGVWQEDAKVTFIFLAAQMCIFYWIASNMFVRATQIYNKPWNLKPSHTKDLLLQHKSIWPLYASWFLALFLT